MMIWKARNTAAGLVLGVLLCSGTAWAQWHDHQGNELPDSAARKQDKGLSANLVMAMQSEFDRFRQEWISTPPEHGPSLSTVESAHRGDEVAVIITYAGCQPSANNAGACDALMDLRVSKPDGSVYFQDEGISLAGNTPPVAKVVQLSPISLKIVFEPEDPLGVYVVEARLNDPSQDAWLELRREITLSDVEPGGKEAD